MREISLRLFVSSVCEDCKRFRKAMEMHGHDCEYIDVNEDVNDALCDRLGIEEVPVFQAFDQKTGEVIMSYTGYQSPIALMGMLADEVSREETNLDIKGVAPSNGIISRPTRPKRRGCAGCKRTGNSK